jgi:hypothetical protein
MDSCLSAPFTLGSGAALSPPFEFVAPAARCPEYAMPRGAIHIEPDWRRSGVGLHLAEGIVPGAWVMPPAHASGVPGADISIDADWQQRGVGQHLDDGEGGGLPTPPSPPLDGINGPWGSAPVLPPAQQDESPGHTVWIDRRTKGVGMTFND